MRVVLVGAGELSVETASLLIGRKHEVVIIDADKERIENLSEQLDCSFLHGEGSKPHILKESAPEHADYLFCLTESDQENIITALVGRSLGFGRVVVQIYDAEYLHICRELDLENTITPSKTIGRYLADMVSGIDILELSALVKGEARYLMIEIGQEEKGRVKDLDLPKEAQVICVYRGEDFRFSDPETALAVGDEAIILTHSRNLPELLKRFHPGQARANNQRRQEK